MAEHEHLRYAALANEMGLQGKDRADFIREQLAADRAERAQERDKVRALEAEIKAKR